MNARVEFQTERFKQGEAVRRTVLGDAHVDRSLSAVGEKSVQLQKLVTETCWAEIWTRPGLTLAQRSMLNLGMLTALNRMHEFRVHVRGALRNGVTEEEIVEVVLQTAVYCGAPAALESMRAAEEVFVTYREEMAEA
ncbi:carboxymuconolactone decarboxylase family protein [Psychromarinibacter halotolerans]|uniref:Carboxymuconolactone decarboxylase family protein n=1 Tax=Psychromarinibacter halotolerans TaxID=1775175 RepID=A0ABV7GRT2_9RHOB|nr:carboxymuconolactone decarboxylase family protein [Psychromarinibacter halotolerans]MDF0598490.1 carboxymuconolactone decarboxylase family protein [Psychromarinibacter halotolerans]